MIINTVEDMNYFKPEIFLLQHLDLVEGQYFDFPSYFARNETFKTQWQTYQKICTIEIPLKSYQPNSFFPTDPPLPYYDLYIKDTKQGKEYAEVSWSDLCLSSVP